MPNIKSAEKRVLVAKIRNERNRSEKTFLRHCLKKFETAIATGSREEAECAYRVAVKAVDKAVHKGILHKNAAARKKGRMAVRLNAMAE